MSWPHAGEIFLIITVIVLIFGVGKWPSISQKWAQHMVDKREKTKKPD